MIKMIIARLLSNLRIKMESIILVINLFRIFCLIITCCMIGYWFHKYLKNEDTTLIEYKLFKDTASVSLPECTICFVDPVLNTSIRGVNGSFSSEGYFSYLKGESGLNETYKKGIPHVPLFWITRLTIIKRTNWICTSYFIE